MRAVQFHGKEDIRLNDVAIPKTAARQVRLRPAFVGICGTDVHEYVRGATLIPENAHPLTRRAAPLTMGHEISGVIDEVGPGVSEVQVGDHVAIQPILCDDTCYACQQNRPNCCAKQGFYGLSTDGGLADYLVVDVKNARKVPSTVPLEVAALIEPLSVGWHAVRCSVTKLTTSALVMGAGPIGLSIIQALRAHGVDNIIAVDTNPARQSPANWAGAHHFLSPLTGNLPEACVRLCAKTQGVEIAYDTAGKQVTLDQCIASLCVGGLVVNVAVWGGPATFMPNLFLRGEKRYMGTAVYTREDFDAVIKAVASGVIDPAFMITSRIALPDVLSDGILKLLHDPGSDLKILVDLSMSCIESE